jgi:LCP family protein required for cell wall assembly
MFVLTIDPSTKTARGLAIPRDLWVDIPSPKGTFQERINTAYIYGETGDYPGGGVQTAETTVENLLGIKINYYVLIDFEGFKKVIDLLDGIDVDVPASLAVDDPYYSETELLGDYYPCIFDAGLHHLDGSDALCFARTRFNSSDLERILRQQLVIFAVMDKASQLNLLSNVDNMVSLWKRYKDTIQTDINDQQIPGFARLATQINRDQMAFLSLGPATTPYTIPSTGAEVLLPSKEGVKQIVDAFLADNKLFNEAATVEVQNGTGEQDTATRAIDYFTSLGIPQSSLVAVNSTGGVQATTEIIDFANKEYTAQRLAGWLNVPLSSIRKATASDAALRSSNADIVVILGSDAQIDAAFASP